MRLFNAIGDAADHSPEKGTHLGRFLTPVSFKITDVTACRKNMMTTATTSAVTVGETP
jgi:hypothetical protein